MNKLLAAIRKGRKLAAEAREVLAEVRKTLVVAVPALGVILGTDSPLYVKAVTLLVALGVYAVPNAKRR